MEPFYTKEDIEWIQSRNPSIPDDPNEWKEELGLDEVDDEALDNAIRALHEELGTDRF